MFFYQILLNHLFTGVHMQENTYIHVQEHFGKKVREKRKNMKLSQEDLARLTSLHFTYISSVERGERNISIINVYKIAKALNCPMKDFLPEI